MNRPQRHHASGQALTEWTVIAPVLMILFMAAAQTGYIIYTRIQVETTAREASRAAALDPVASGAFTSPPLVATTSGSPTTCPTGNSTNPACNAAHKSAGLVPTGNMTITISGASNGTPVTCAAPATKTEPQDGTATVTVLSPVPIFVPFLGNFFGGTSHNFSSTVTTRVEPCFFTAGVQ
jgi:hypothetical protein